MKTHRKSLQKRIDLKTEENQILPIDTSQLARVLCSTYIRSGDN